MKRQATWPACQTQQPQCAFAILTGKRFITARRTILHDTADGQGSREAKVMPLLGWLLRGAAGLCKQAHADETRGFPINSSIIETTAFAKNRTLNKARAHRFSATVRQKRKTNFEKSEGKRRIFDVPVFAVPLYFVAPKRRHCNDPLGNRRFCEGMVVFVTGGMNSPYKLISKEP
jgi:hypothetical protein